MGLTAFQARRRAEAARGMQQQEAEAERRQEAEVKKPAKGKAKGDEPADQSPTE